MPARQRRTRPKFSCRHPPTAGSAPASVPAENRGLGGAADPWRGSPAMPGQDQTAERPVLPLLPPQRHSFPSAPHAPSHTYAAKPGSLPVAGAGARPHAAEVDPPNSQKSPIHPASAPYLHEAAHSPDQKHKSAAFPRAEAAPSGAPAWIRGIPDATPLLASPSRHRGNPHSKALGRLPQKPPVQGAAPRCSRESQVKS